MLTGQVRYLIIHNPQKNKNKIKFIFNLIFILFHIFL